jgi:Z1 domain
MPADNPAMLEKAVFATLPPERRPTEAEVLGTASALRRAFTVSDEEFAALIKSIHAKLTITMELGTSLVKTTYAPWLAAKKATIDPFYWERLRSWLGRLDWPPLVINTLDQVSDDILDLAGDPQRGGAWAGRGLVVGDVQSGKTAAYTALISKAADSGYRLIILLTGRLESLRRQTQERLDEGFVGLDSSEVLQQAQMRTNRAVGVGIIDGRRAAGVFTSRSRDFNRQLVTQLGFRLDSSKEPVLVVIKKNKSILENLEIWLKGYNSGPDGKIGEPLLLIDDEADEASINTNPESADPTRINERVRALLALFHRSSYVGFTATPFANVFIDPDTADEMLGDDLFPRDFIYTLEVPTNYVGPQQIFAEPPTITRWNEDAEAFFPEDHKLGHPVPDLPPSLHEALRCFLISTTLRDLRGEGRTHRSMLVNVSRFTAVQDQVAALLDGEMRDMQRDVRNFSHLGPEEALKVPSIRSLRETWAREFDVAEFDWPRIQLALHDAIQPISVRAVNQRTGAASLDYKTHREQGLRVIAVGGNSLSRGLTLEGLSTSYFYRNSQMYDTLLQMGRWFGYRDGYADLCRLWLSEEAFQWYAHITTASDELRREFKRMRRLNLTPKDFGLKVRAHPDSLIVTARNKMRRANSIVRRVSLDGKGIETARLRSSSGVIRANRDAVARFIEGLTRTVGNPGPSEFGSTIWRDIPKETIATLLAEFETHPLNYDFQADQLSEFLERTPEPRLQLWDVVIPNGSLKAEEIGGVTVTPSERRVLSKPDSGSLLVSGSSARVGSRGIEREGLSREQFERIQAASNGKNISDQEFRDVRNKPLLLLHVLRGYTAKIGKADKAWLDPDGPPLVALGLSFPRFDDSDIAGWVEYKVNIVQWRSMFEREADDDVVVDDDVD